MQFLEKFFLNFVPLITRYLCANFHEKRLSQSGNMEGGAGSAKIKNSPVQVGLNRGYLGFETEVLARTMRQGFHLGCETRVPLGL